MKFEHTKVYNFMGAIRNMRNSWESWDKIDSLEHSMPYATSPKEVKHRANVEKFQLGEADKALALRLIHAGSDHAKFLRQILISVDITAPLYFFKQFDQYKVGTVTNSTSTMHTITKHPINANMFSVEDLEGYVKRVEIKPNEVDEGKEVWKDYPLNDLYSISDYGRVKRKAYTTTHGRYWGEKILKNIEQHDKYLSVNILLKDGKRKSMRVHRLVAQTFLENPENKEEVNHKDGNKQNNHISNLEWATRKENAQHSVSTGLQSNNSETVKKQQMSIGKTTEEQRLKIVEEYQEGATVRDLADKYGVSHTTISSVINGKYFKDPKKNAFEMFEDYLNDLEQIRKLFVETKDKRYWRTLIQMLPDSMNQKRGFTANYQVLRAMYFSRKNHRLAEWETFRQWVESLPYSELITAEKSKKKVIEKG